MGTGIQDLRRSAIQATLFQPTSLLEAIERLGFVQCDPIRAPARAQDLILRHRVQGYRAGDLERLYPELDLEEDFLYAYGIVPKATWRLLHPRSSQKLNKTEARVHALVSAREKLHPRELETHLGKKREVNAWGSYSKATTRCLESLHYRGVLRVAGRQNGIRLYQQAKEQEEHLSPTERLEGLALLTARILTPVPERSLRSALSYLRYSAPTLPGRKDILKRLIAGGALTGETVDGVKYLWPKECEVFGEVPKVVRFLAPFDPLVWDRYRFEHLWGWAYRFEAYTPPAKRKMGYYALPLLWGEQVIGWVNVSGKEGQLAIEPGFIGDEPKTRAFRSAFADEVEKMRWFLGRRQSEGA